ncbi:hypothetical protein ACFWBC_05640 [Streptomyces sp. NPDC059985]
MLRDGIDAFLTEVDPEELDAGHLEWSLVRALNRVEAARPTV